MAARLNATDSANRQPGLHKSLTTPQMAMISLGGAIGTGLFLGSGMAINSAGPAVLFSYIIAGFIATVVVLSIAEMAVIHADVGSIGVYAELYLGRWAGFVVRWTYWAGQTIGTSGEAVAAGLYMSFWFPNVALWTWSVGFAFILVYVNSRTVGKFGTTEYWLTFIKVTAICLFIVLGLASIFGIGSAPIGLHNLTQLPGGFLPHGLGGVWVAVIVGIFSYTGVEVIAVTAGEAADPKVSVPAAMKMIAARLLLFYILAITIVVTIAPWNRVGADEVRQSPFVLVFAHSGIAYAAGIVNFIVIAAALSSMNTNIYLCSRMLYSLSGDGFAPAILSRLNRAGSPIYATLGSGAVILMAAALSRLTPHAFTYLFGIGLFGAIVVWMIILCSHLSFRRAHSGQPLPVRFRFFPWIQIAALALLVAVLVTMGFDPRFSTAWTVGIPWLLLLSAGYLVTIRHSAPKTVEAATALLPRGGRW